MRTPKPGSTNDESGTRSTVGVHWLANLQVVQQAMTPKDQLVTVGLGATVTEAKLQGQLGPFDQLAVVDPRSNQFVGLIWLEDVERAEADALLDAYVARLQPGHAVDVGATLGELIDHLVRRQACLVSESENVVGLIHLSDLNKHCIRVAVYAQIALLEMLLARLIGEQLDPGSWIDCLREPSQVKVLGKREVDRLRNIEISPIQYVDLSDLVDVVAKTELWRGLGYGSKNHWLNEAGGIVKLRHSVMHPVRSLVSDTASLERLQSRERRLRELVQRLA